MLNKSKNQESLPRIQSQKRVNTAFERKDSNRDAQSNQVNLYLQKTQPNNRQLKRTLSAVNNCKAVKYEVTGIMYTKKLQQLEKQNSLLDIQLKKVQQEIKDQRKINTVSTKHQAKQKTQTFLTEASKATDSKVSLRKNINLSDEKSLNNEIRISENKIQMLRKKIDEQLQKNQKMRKQVDIVRKQINTIKIVSKNIQNSLQKTSQQFNQLSQLSKVLEQQIASKNALMHKAKIEGQHKKAQIIKQYDKILKQLDKELSGDYDLGKNISETASNHPMYITQSDQHKFTPIFSEPIKNTKLHLAVSRRSKYNINNQIIAVKNKLQRYEKQFQQLKNQTGTKTTEQAVLQFQDKYEKNFNFYNYINQLHSTLQQKQKQNEQLKNKKNILLQQIEAKASDTKFQEIIKIQNSLSSVKAQKMKYSNISHQYQNTLNKLKQTIKLFYLKIDMNNDLKIQNLSEDNLVHYLASIKQRCFQLDQKFQDQVERLQFHQFSTQNDLAEMLQNAKKQNTHESTDVRNEKILSRQQFLKARQTFMKKRQTPRKTLYKK